MHAIQQNKSLFSSVNQPTHQLTNPVVENNQPFTSTHEHAREWITTNCQCAFANVSRASPHRARVQHPRTRAILAQHISSHHPMRSRAPIHGRTTRQTRIHARTRSCDPRPNAFARDWCRDDPSSRRDRSRRTLVTMARRAVEDFFVVAIVVVANVVLEESIAACIVS